MILKTERTGSAVKVIVESKDTEGLPFSFLKEVHFGLHLVNPAIVCKRDPYHWTMQQAGSKTRINVKLVFQANYGEPDVDIPLTVDRGIYRQIVLHEH